MSRLSVIQPGSPEEMFPEIVLSVKSPVSPDKLLILCLVRKWGGFSGQVDFGEADVREKAEQKGLRNDGWYRWESSPVPDDE